MQGCVFETDHEIFQVARSLLADIRLLGFSVAPFVPLSHLVYLGCFWREGLIESGLFVQRALALVSRCQCALRESYEDRKRKQYHGALRGITVRYGALQCITEHCSAIRGIAVFGGYGGALQGVLKPYVASWCN